MSDSSNPNKPIIKHLVISGGGVYGLSALGALNHLSENGYWNINNIESIYGTSIGAIISTILALKYEWPILQNYIINRPWEKTFKFDMYSIINSFQKKEYSVLQNLKKYLNHFLAEKIYQ